MPKKASTPRKAATKKAPVKKAAAKKTATKKATTRKPAAKKTAARKTTVKAKALAVVKKSTTPIAEAMSKSQILSHIAEEAVLTKKQVTQVFESLSDLITRHVKKRGAGMFNLHGLMKLTVIDKPATKARKGVNPFTGEPTTFKAKPARRQVKVRALKKLKDMAA